MPLSRLAMDASKTDRKRKLGSARVLTSTTEKERLLRLSAEKIKIKLRNLMVKKKHLQRIG